MILFFILINLNLTSHQIYFLFMTLDGKEAKSVNKVKAIPKTVFDQIRRRRKTINVTENQYKPNQRYKSPKTQKKQTYVQKHIKAQFNQHKPIKSLFTQCKKQPHHNSIAQYESDITPKKLLFYHIDTSQSKRKPQRKIHSISLVDTPKKSNIKKKTQQFLFTVQQQRDNKPSCKKLLNSGKFSSKSSINNKQLKIQSNKLLQSIEQNHHDVAFCDLKSSVKNNQMKNTDNYDYYYHSGTVTTNNNSSLRLRPNKKPEKGYQTYLHNSSVKVDKQKSCRTLKINRNSMSSNRVSNIASYIKKSDLHNLINSRNVTKSQNIINSPRVQQFETQLHKKAETNEKKFQKMFQKCSLILQTYNKEMLRLKDENEYLRKENEFLKSSLSQKEF